MQPADIWHHGVKTHKMTQSPYFFMKILFYTDIELKKHGLGYIDSFNSKDMLINILHGAALNGVPCYYAQWKGDVSL